MTDIFALLRETAVERMAKAPPEDFLVRGIWRVELAFRPNPAERTFKYTFWLAMTRGQGCCYCTGDDQRGRELVGHDVRELVAEKTCISIAALDSLYASMERRPVATYHLVGTPIEKTDTRTEIILHEAERLVSGISTRKARVVNVGLVGNIVRNLVARGYDVRASDMERDTVGTKVHGVLVEDGTRTYTDSLELIVEEARKSGTKLLVFAETGANFGEEYCRAIGVDTVVSELFPFYIFQGTSTIEVYRKA
jgi:hypothetical protein